MFGLQLHWLITLDKYLLSSRLGRVDYDLAGGAGGWFFHWILASFVAFYLIFAGMELVGINGYLLHTCAESSEEMGLTE